MFKPPLFNPKGIPKELRDIPQWALFRAITNPAKNRYDKVPYQANGNNASSNKPDTWGKFIDLWNAYEAGHSLVNPYSGLAFMLTKEVGLVFIDIDHCRNPETGEIDPVAREVMAQFPGTYWEASFSGEGVHCVLASKKPGDECRRANSGLGIDIEIYDSGRVVSMTGNMIEGFPKIIGNCQDALNDLYARAFPPRSKREIEESEGKPGQIENDDDLLEMARSATNGEKFSALYDNGDTSAYGGDASSADMALALGLTFWCGRDPQRVDRLFRASALMRDKWDEKRGQQTYGEKTIDQAMEVCSEFYQPPARSSAGFVDDFGKGSRKGSKTPPPVHPDTEWEPIAPLTKYPVPRFPLEVLPPTIHPFAMELVASFNVVEDLVGVLLLGSLACAAARRCRVQIGVTHNEPLNLYTLLALPPGKLKSPVLKQIAAPLREYERDMSRRHKIARDFRKEIESVWEATLKRLKSELSKEQSTFQKERLEAEIKEIKELQSQPLYHPKMFTTDATNEAMATFLSEQEDQCIAILDAEGGAFANISGLYTNGQSNMDLALKGHDGDEVRIDRVSKEREPIYLEQPLITLALAVQPSILESVQKNVKFQGLGFAARFLYSFPDSPNDDDAYSDRAVSASARALYRETISHMLMLPKAAPVDEPTSRYVLQIQGESLRIWAHYRNIIAKQKKIGGKLEHIAEWASKLAGRVARIAGILHLAECRGCRNPWSYEIQPMTMAGAWAIGYYFAQHALKAYGVIGIGEEVTHAIRVRDWMLEEMDKAGGAAAFRTTERGVFMRFQKLFNKVDKAQAALQVLYDHGYIRVETGDPKGGKGRKPSPVIAVHPDRNQWLI